MREYDDGQTRAEGSKQSQTDWSAISRTEAEVIPSLRVNEPANPADRSFYDTNYTQDLNLVSIYKDSRDGVIHLTADRANGDGTTRDVTGSGFFITPDGKVATDLHVIRGSKNIRIRTSDGRTYKAQIENVDEKTDLAILKVEKDSPYQSFKILPLGSSQNLYAGDQVVALGHPKGWEPVFMSNGSFRTTRLLRDLLPKLEGGTLPGEDLNRQLVDANLHVQEGNSGGPLLDSQGRVVGIVGLSNSKNSAQSTPVEDLLALLNRTNKIGSRDQIATAGSISLQGITGLTSNYPGGSRSFYNFKPSAQTGKPSPYEQVIKATPTTSEIAPPGLPGGNLPTEPVRWDSKSLEQDKQSKIDLPSATHTLFHGFNTYRSLAALKAGSGLPIGGLFSAGLGSYDLMFNDYAKLKSSLKEGNSSDILSASVQVGADVLLIGGGAASISRRFGVAGLLATAGGSLIKAVTDGGKYTGLIQ